MRIIIAVFCIFLSVMPASAEWAGEIYGGVAKTSKADVTDTSSLGLTATVTDVKLDASGTVGGRIGYWFPEFAGLASFGMGLDAFVFGADIDQQTVPVQFGGFSGTGTLNRVDVEVLGIGFDVLKLRLHLSKSEQYPQGQLQPYATAGPALFRAKFKDTNNVTPNNQSESDTALGVKVGLGLQYLVTSNIGLFGEYRFTHFTADASFQDTTAPASTETLSSTFNTHHLVGGLAFHF